ADRGFGGDQQAGNRGRVLQRGADDLGRVDHTGLDQVLVSVGLGVEALRLVGFAQQVAGNHRTVMTGVLGDLANRGLDGLAHDVDAAGLVIVLAGQTVESLGGVEQRGAAARNDAFFHGRTGRVQRVVDAVLALLHFDFRSAADLDHRNTAGQLGQAFLQLLTVVVAGRGLDLRADLLDPGLDVGLVAGTIDDRGVVLVDGDALGFAEHADRDVLELDAEVFGNHLALGQDRDVLQHRLAAIAEARSLDRRDLQAAAQLVDHQGGQRFAFDVLGDDEERTAALHHGLEDRQHRLQVRELLLVDQDVRAIQLDDHLLGVGHEVRAEVAAVELHALDHVELEFEALGFLDGDHAFLADLLHRLGDLLADFDVAVGRNNADLGDLLRARDVLRAA